MKYEIRWTEDDKPLARRVDRQPMTDEDRAEVRVLVEKMLRHELCFNCGAEWSETVKDVMGRSWRVCWACAKSA